MSRVLVAQGYRTAILVERGHLIVRDGFPSDGSARELRFSRGQCGLHRLVIRSAGGSISIPAIDWCHRMGITVVFVASDSTLGTCLIPDQPHDGPLKRVQAVSAVTDDGVALARYLLNRKFESQAHAVEHDFVHYNIGSEKSRVRAANELRSCMKSLQGTVTLTELLVREGYAAKTYWELLNGTKLPWPAWCLRRIPAHWAFISPRFSGGRSRVRDARDPFNAILNYCYTLLEVETRVACASYGLDPDLGLLHVDDRLRESFVYDLLEPLRAPVDVEILDLIFKHELRPHMFHELRDGAVRLDPDFAKVLATDLMPRFRKNAMQAADDYAKQLRRIKVPYKLVRREREPIVATTTEVASECKYCHQPLPRKGLKFCGRRCYLSYSVEVARPIDKAREKLAKMRAQGVSPGHGGEAAKKRGKAIAQSNRRRSLGLSPEESRARRAAQQREYRARKVAKV